MIQSQGTRQLFLHSRIFFLTTSIVYRDMILFSWNWKIQDEGMDSTIGQKNLEHIDDSSIFPGIEEGATDKIRK